MFCRSAYFSGNGAIWCVEVKPAASVTLNSDQGYCGESFSLILLLLLGIFWYSLFPLHR